MGDVLGNVVPIEGQILLRYTFHPATRRRCDTANMLCISDKYFSDSLTEYGIIPDDDSTIIPKVEYNIGPIVKGGMLTVEIISI